MEMKTIIQFAFPPSYKIKFILTHRRHRDLDLV